MSSTRKVMGRWAMPGKKYKSRPHMRRFPGIPRHINHVYRSK